MSQDASIPNLKDAASKDIKVAITNMNLKGDPSLLAGGYTSDDATNGKIVGTNAAKFIKDNINGRCEYRPGGLRRSSQRTVARRAGVVSSPAWTRPA